MTSRGISATADAYLTPVIKKYVESFRDGFKDSLSGDNVRCEFMQSDGGLVSFEKYITYRTTLVSPI